MKRNRGPVRREAMRKEYDFSRGVRGKYASRSLRGSNVVVLSPDVARRFPTAESVDHALHAQLVWRSLTLKERMVLVLYYYEQVTYREIGESLGLSEARVERIHARVIKRLRDRMQPLVRELLSR